MRLVRFALVDFAPYGVRPVYSFVPAAFGSRSRHHVQLENVDQAALIVCTMFPGVALVMRATLVPGLAISVDWLELVVQPLMNAS